MKSVQIIANSRAVGLEAAYARQGDFGSQKEWEQLITGASKQVDIMGRTAFGWCTDVVAKIIVKKIVRDDVDFRWLIMDKSNKYLPLLKEENINIGDMLLDKLKHVEAFLAKIRSQLPEAKRAKLQVKMFADVPLYCGIVRIDDRLYVTHYMFNSPSNHSPLSVLRGSDETWTKAYRSEFDLIWEHSTDVFQSAAGVSTSGS